MILAKNDKKILSKSKWSCFINRHGELVFFIYFMQEIPKLKFIEILKENSLKLLKNNEFTRSLAARNSTKADLIHANLTPYYTSTMLKNEKYTQKCYKEFA